MKKYIVGVIIALGLLIGVPLYAASPSPLDKLISIFATSLGLQNQYLERIAENTEPKSLVLGNIASRALRIYSSSSATSTPAYFGWPGGVLTATTSLLTIGCYGANEISATSSIIDIDSMGIFAQATASTSAGQIFIQPQVSNDCMDWYDMTPYEQVTTAGSAIDTISLPIATSTSYTWTPGGLGLRKRNFVLNNITGRAIRFNVSVGVASSSVFLQAAAIERISR